MTTGIDIVNVHVHLADTLEHEKAIFPKPGAPDDWFVGNPDYVIPFMDRVGVSYTFAMNRMNTTVMLKRRLEKIPENKRKESEPEIKADLIRRIKDFNTWACDYHKKEPRIIPFAGIDIGVFFDQKPMMEELEEKIKMGVRGVKIHPAGGFFFASDKRMYPLYDRCVQAGLPVLVDSGCSWPTAQVPGGHGEPITMTPVLKDFPRLKFVMAHLPAAYWDERVEIAKEYPQIMFDTSMGFFNPLFQVRDGDRACHVEDAVRFLRKVGVEKVLFGTDESGDNTELQAGQILALKLDDSEKRKILSENAKAFFGLK